MRNWTEADRQRHSELMRDKLLNREWQPWQVAGDRTVARYNALRHGRHSAPGLERRRLRKELRMTASLLAGQIERNLQLLRGDEVERVSSPIGAAKQLRKISKRLREADRKIADLMEYRKTRRKK